jgi:uncharacterized protein (TIGR03067 family)
MPRVFLLPVLLTGVLAAAGASADDAADKAMKDANGTHELVSIEVDGQAAPADTVKGLRLVIKDGTYKLVKGKEELESGTFQVVEIKGKLAKVDTKVTAGEAKGKTILQLVELTDDKTTHICTTLDGKTRPTEVTAKKGSGQVVAKYQRVKE